MATVKLSVVVLVDAAGDYALGQDADAAREAYEQNVGELNAADGFRLFDLTLEVPLPAVVELAGAVPEDGGQVALTAAGQE